MWKRERAFLFEHEVSRHSCNSVLSSCSEQQHILWGCFLSRLESSCQITFLPELTDLPQFQLHFYCWAGGHQSQDGNPFWYKAILALPTTVLLQKQRTRSNGYSCSVDLHSTCAYSLSISSAFSPSPHPLLCHIGG